MHIHTVYFWITDDSTEAQREGFEGWLKKLTTISSIQEAYWGIPAATGERAVVDDSYSYSITFLFEDLAAHDAYQIAPLHCEFVEANKTLWTKVQVYDVTVK